MSRIIRSSQRIRLGRIVIVLGSLTVAFVIPGAERSLAAANATATLNVVYNASGTISVTLPDGTPVGTPSAPGTVIPPGTYSIVFNNKAEVVHMFHLAGPGVKLSTDLRPIGEDAMCAGITGLYSLQTYQETFLPNSTYVFQDDYQPNIIHGVFSTSGSSSTVGTSSEQSNRGSGHLITGTSSSVSGLASNGTALRPRRPRGVGRRDRNAQPDVQGQARREAEGGAVHDNGYRQELEGRFHAAEGQPLGGGRGCGWLRREALAEGRSDRRAVVLLPDRLGEEDLLHRQLLTPVPSSWTGLLPELLPPIDSTSSLPLPP